MTRMTRIVRINKDFPNKYTITMIYWISRTKILKLQQNHKIHYKTVSQRLSLSLSQPNPRCHPSSTNASSSACCLLSIFFLYYFFLHSLFSLFSLLPSLFFLFFSFFLFLFCGNFVNIICALLLFTLF